MAFLLKHVSKSPRIIWSQRGFSTSSPIIFSEEVLGAKSEGKPLVALESTIITHGMPYPQNLETAVQVENIIRQQGAVPATVAILKGQLTVGLTAEQLQYLARAKGVVKASRRDLAPVVAAGLDGATTVAGTIIAAELADIPVFVTGGIGGVHREGETTLDVSADLNELGRSNTLVVCSGVKSILDIGRTLEYLETQGVCVCAFGESNDFPAFYTRKSGHKAPHRVSNAEEAAKLLYASRRMCLSSGIVVAVPVPKEYAMNEAKIEEAISEALREAKVNGVCGKEVTPFILAAVAKATGGASLDANIALIKNNAKVGADIAVEYIKVKNVRYSKNASNISGKMSSKHFHTWSAYRARAGLGNERATTSEGDTLFPGGAGGDVLVIGGANVDRTYRTSENVHLDGSTHPCTTEQCGGGVGRNMAEALWRLRGGRTRLLTAVGDDADGQYLADIAPGLLLDGCIVKNSRTATYAAVLDPKGECLLGLGDMDLHNHITVDLVNRHLDVLEQAPLVVIDGNVPQQTMDHVLRQCHRMNKPVFFEATDRRKATKGLHHKEGILYSSPNLSELRAMAQFLSPKVSIEATKDINEIIELSKIVSHVIDFFIVTVGANGVVTVKRADKSNDRNTTLVVNHYPVRALAKIENVSGAGDCFASGFIHGMLLGYEEAKNVFLGFESAKQVLYCKNTVPKNLCIASHAVIGAEHFVYKVKCG